MNPTHIGFEPGAIPSTTLVQASILPPLPTTMPASTTTVRAAEFPLEVYWIRDDLLVASRLREEESTLPRALSSLRIGPRLDQKVDGLRSAIPAPEMIEGASSSGGVASVRLLPSFLTLPGGEQTLMVSQIVFTLTGIPGIGQVQFFIEGRSLDVPDAAGQPKVGPVSRDDFRAFLETSLPPSTMFNVPIPTSAPPTVVDS